MGEKFHRSEGLEKTERWNLEKIRVQAALEEEKEKKNRWKSGEKTIRGKGKNPIFSEENNDSIREVKQNPLKERRIKCAQPVVSPSLGEKGDEKLPRAIEGEFLSLCQRGMSSGMRGTKHARVWERL